MQASARPQSVLSIAIVVHNSPLPALRATLQTVQQAVQEALRTGVVQSAVLTLVDNASAPHYREQLGQELAQLDTDARWQLDYLPLEENRGFGAGHNAAIQRAAGEYHLILNPDVELATDCLVSGLSRLAASPDIVVLSPLVSGPDGRREYLCKTYPSLWVLLLRGFAPACLRRRFDHQLAAYELRQLCSGDAEVDVDIASGCFMLARREALVAVGGFDEGFFLYFEDFDLSLRLRERGRLVFSPAITIVHSGGYAARKGLRHVLWFTRSAWRFFNRHGWRWV